VRRLVRYELSAPVTWLIAAVSAGVYVAQRYGGTWAYYPAPVGAVDKVWHAFGYVRDLILHGEPWRLVTPNLIHTADWGHQYDVPRGLLHLLAVIVGLIAIGPLVERIYGHRRLAVIYITSGTAAYAVLLGLGRDPFLQGGATGAVFGIAGAFLVYALVHGREQRQLVRPAVVVFVLLAAAQYGWNAPNPRILHVAGVFAGAVLGLLLEPRDRLRVPPPVVEPVAYAPPAYAASTAPEPPAVITPPVQPPPVQEPPTQEPPAEPPAEAPRDEPTQDRGPF
jgi:membrane associated rhomboid family serine protease